MFLDQFRALEDFFFFFCTWFVDILTLLFLSLRLFFTLILFSVQTSGHRFAQECNNTLSNSFNN